ncbi:hypothetical protein HK096_010437, partial [Nowakowskiella sp. JEL0078]
MQQLPNSYSLGSLAQPKGQLLEKGRNDQYTPNIEYAQYTDNIWQAIVTKITPLFNGEGLKGSIRDINELVRQWLRETPTQHVVDEISDLLAAGTEISAAKLQTVPDEVLASRIVESWSFFFVTVLPYIQGVFLPVRLNKGSNITSMTINRNRALSTENHMVIDVRNLAICSFRDNALLPLSHRIEDCLPRLFLDTDNIRRVADTSTRMTQMLSIICQESVGEEKQRV